MTVPLSFVLNKLWTFSSVRGGEHPTLAEEEIAEEQDGTAAPQLAVVPGDADPRPAPRRSVSDL